jgi:hypothetical protein
MTEVRPEVLDMAPQLFPLSELPVDLADMDVVRELEPDLVWLAHEHEPWHPS